MSEDITINNINKNDNVSLLKDNINNKKSFDKNYIDDESAYYEKSNELIESETYNSNENETKPFDINDYKKHLQGYIFYKGERISQFDFLKQAVDNGDIVIDETKSAFDNYNTAWNKLIQDKAKPLFNWSTSLYSQDGMYKFRVENGVITGATLAMNSDGIKWIDIAYELAGGKLPDEVSSDVFGFIHGDYELFDASRDIGDLKRVYNHLEFTYKNNNEDYKNYINSLNPLILTLLGQNAKNINMENIFLPNNFFNQDSINYAKNSLENYDKEFYKKALSNVTIY